METVFSVSMITTFAPDGKLPGLGEAIALGFRPQPNPKVNLGLGKPGFRPEDRR